MKHAEIEKALLAQRDQTTKAEDANYELKRHLKEIESNEEQNSAELKEIDSEVSKIFNDFGMDPDKIDLEYIQPDIEISATELNEIEKGLFQFEPLETIEFTNWEDYKNKVNLYINKYNIDISIDPIYQLLTPGQLSEVDEKYRLLFKRNKWDKWDYIFVGASGVLASLSDFLLVKTPKTINTGEFAGQKGSPITEWLKKYDITQKSDGAFVRNDWFSNWARGLEESCKVPYDAMSTSINGKAIDRIPGMGGRSHRLQSLGHDPVLGLIFGVLDILRGTITGFSYDKLIGNHSFFIGQQMSFLPGQGPSLIAAILKQLGHLISDVATPMGLPAPFMSLLQGINVGNFGEKGRSVGELTRWMYLNGYDFRHFLVSGITPAVIEIILRAYIMLRHYSEHGETKILLASDPKYRSMFLCAHAIAAAGNIGKIYLQQGNPLAINFAEWMALFRYLIPSLKYWLFEKPRAINRIYEERWEQLRDDSRKIYSSKSLQNLEMIKLG